MRVDLLDDVGVDAVDPAEHVRQQESVMVGEMPVERSAQLILLLYLDRRGRPEVRNTADQGIGCPAGEFKPTFNRNELLRSSPE